MLTFTKYCKDEQYCSTQHFSKLLLLHLLNCRFRYRLSVCSLPRYYELLAADGKSSDTALADLYCDEDLFEGLGFSVLFVKNKQELRKLRSGKQQRLNPKP